MNSVDYFDQQTKKSCVFINIMYFVENSSLATGTTNPANGAHCCQSQL